MNPTAKNELFESMPIPKAVMTLAVPTVLATLVMVLYNLADTWFVGLVNDPIQNSAVTLAAPVLLAFNAVNNLFGVGTSSLMSRALGRKDYETVTRASAFGFWCSALCGALFSLLVAVFASPLLHLLGAKPENLDATRDYLFWTVICGAMPAILNVVMAYLVRSEGSSLHASIGAMSGCLLNIILDPFFILPWGLGMGAAGAGFATFLSNCAACLYFFVFLLVKRGKTFVCIDPRQFRLQKKIVADVCGVGIPASIQNLLNVTGMTVLNNFTSAFGSEAVSAMGISHKVSMIPLYVSMGITQGIMPLISYNYSGGNSERLKRSVTYSAKLSISFMVLVTVLFALFPGNITAMFMKNEQIIAYGTRFLRGMSLCLPFLCMDFLAVAVFQACGMGKRSFVFAVLRKIVLEIPALFLLNRLFPLYGLAYAQPVAEFVLAVAAIFSLISIFRSLPQSPVKEE